MKKIIFLFLLIPSLSVLNAQIDPDLAGALFNVLEEGVMSDGNHGISSHLILADGSQWSGAYGEGQGNSALDQTTVFHGASTTKLNVAILMLLLSEEGLVDLDASWTEYIQLDVNFDEDITIRQLLNHTSGIADYLEAPGSGANITSDFSYFYTPEEILEDIVSGTPVFPPGSNFQYSNSNYVLAALIIEAVTGNPVHEELRNRIWQPLGMEHTYFGAYEEYSESRAGIWWNFGEGVQNYSDVSTVSMLSYAYGAGNIVTCPEDLALLLRALFKGEILQEETMEEMLEIVPASQATWTFGYGLGVHRAYNLTTDLILGHDGYYTNMTDAFYSMDCGFTLVTMTNSQTDWFAIFNRMYDIVAAYCEDVHVATEEIDEGAGMKLYPNPTTGYVEIEGQEVIQEISIIDMTGKVYLKSNPRTRTAFLNMERSGMYIVEITMDGQTVAQRLVVE